jgi:hypothetical protein
MTNTTKPKEKMYKFRGKTFPCDAKTMQILNNALALNQSKEKYEPVERNSKKNN